MVKPSKPHKRKLVKNLQKANDKVHGESNRIKELTIVREAAELQLSIEDIAIIIRQSNSYVQDLYFNDVEHHRMLGKFKMLQAQFKKAHEGNTNMQMWLGKHYFGQREGVNNTTFEPEFRILTKAIERFGDGSVLLIDNLPSDGVDSQRCHDIKDPTTIITEPTDTEEFEKPLYNSSFSEFEGVTDAADLLNGSY